MKRVLMITGFSLLVSLALLSFLPTKTQWIPAIVFIVISFILLIFSKRFNVKALTLISSIIAFSCCSLFISDVLATLNLQKYDETPIAFSGYVDSVETNGCVFKAEIAGKVRSVYLIEYDDTFTLGETLKVKGEISEASNLGFVKARNFKSSGCYLVLENVEYIPINKSDVSFYPKLKPIVWNFKNALLESAEQLFSERTNGILKAVLLGHKNDISLKDSENFKTSGLNHYMAISGLHTGIIASAVFFLFKRLNKRLGAVITVIFVLLYMTLVGFSYSVTRAGIMAIITFIGIAFFLRSDTPTSLGFAVLCILLTNPYSAADIGFQLSVLATVGVVFISPRINEFLQNKFEKLPFKRLKNFLFSVLATTLGANIALIPHYLFVLNNISLVSPISNMLAAVFMPYPVIFGMLSLLISKIPIISALSSAIKYLAEIPMLIIIKIAEYASLIPYANVRTGQVFLYVWFFATLGFVCYLILTKRKKLLFRTIILSLSSLFVLVLCYNVSNNRNITLTMANSYNGNAIIASDNNATVVVATSLDEYLSYGIDRTLGVLSKKDIDLLVVGKDEDLTLIEFLNNYDVKTLCIKEDNFTLEQLECIYQSSQNVYEISKTDISINDRMSLKIRTDSLGNVIYYTSLDDVNVSLCDGEFKLTDFHNDFYDSDIFIINDKCPKGLEYYDATQIFLTNDEYSREIYKQINFVCDNIDFAQNLTTVKIFENSYKIN